jgi:predicted outer membrane repeat protein
LTVANGFTNSGTVELTTTGPDPTRSATLDVTSGSLTNAGTLQSLVGAGFDGNSGRTLGAELINEGTINVGMPLTLSKSGAAHVNGAGGVINVTGGDLSVVQSGPAASFTNDGTSNISAGRTFTLSGGTFTNFDAGTSTLTGGTYNIAGTFRFSGASILTNAANITLIGSVPGIQDLSSNNALANFTTNTGSFTLTGGAVVSTAGDFSNQGAVTIDATTGATKSQFGAAGNYNQSGAGTTTLAAGGILALGDAAKIVNIQSGTLLQGTGTVNGNVSNSGTLSPGTSTTPGTLSISGTYTQTAGGTLNIKLGGTTTPGTDYDDVAITGAATLDGTIHTQAINGFEPAGGDSYQVMTFASSSGDFSSKTGISFSHAFLVEEFTAGSLLLAGFANPVVVNNPGDVHVNGQTSLREAIDAANTGSRLGVAVTISFDASLSGTTLTLAQGVLEIGKDGAGSGAITIDGSSLASPLTISGNHAGRVFQIDAGVQATLIGLDVTAGSTSSAGGAILNDGTLSLNHMLFTNNSAGLAGGAVASSGSLILTGSTFTNNSVTTGTGDGGGALAVTAGGATITGNTFTGNSITAVAVGTANSAGGAIVTLAPTSTIQFNRFSGNTDATPANGNTLALIAGATFNDDDNWWLSNSGPAANDVVKGAGGIFTPNPVSDFLMLSVSASPTPILVGAHSTVTAGFTTDSAGNSISAANLGALAGLTASFAGNTLSGSSLTGTPATIQNGQAAVTYNAGAAGGIDTVTTTVDGVMVSTNLTVQQPPSITSLDHAAFTVGMFGSFTVQTASFPVSSLSESGALPSGVHFHDNGDGTATLSGTPDVGTGKQYTLTITASNGAGADFQQTFTLTVNEAISFTSARTATFRVGVDTPFVVRTLGFPLPALSATGVMPAGVGLVDQHDGTAILSGNAVPNTGAYVFTITAHNGITADATQTFTLTVIDPPTFTTPNSASATVGQKLLTPISIATSPGLPLAVKITESGKLPTGLVFTPGKNGTATITGTPRAGSGGTYAITLTASSGGFQSTQPFALTVNEPGVLSPTFSSPSSATFTAGQSQPPFSITTNPGLPAKTTVTEKGALPLGLKFVPGLNGTASITGTPRAGTGGTYMITLFASNGLRQTAQSFTLTVDQAPAITSPASGTLPLGQNGAIVIKTTGFPAPTVQLSTGETLPAGVQLVNINGVWMLSGAAASAGSTAIHLVASNGIGADFTQTFTLNVVAAPTFGTLDPNPFQVGLAQSLSITTSPGGSAKTTVTEKGKLPAGLRFVPGPNGTAMITGKPAANTGGQYPITLIASNGAAQVTQAYTLTVNQPPAIIGGTSISFAVGQPGLFAIKTTGFPHPGLAPAGGSLPQGVQFIDNGNGTGMLTGVPAAGSAGSYTFQVIATNSLGSTAAKSFTLTVNQSPIFTPVNTVTFTTGVSGTFTIHTDVGTKPTAKLTEMGTLPMGVTFVDHHDGTATLKGTPAKGSKGTYTVIVTASDGVLPAALQVLTITVG